MRILRVSCFLLICFPVGHYSHGLFLLGQAFLVGAVGKQGRGELEHPRRHHTRRG
jgi:hypothetical protein